MRIGSKTATVVLTLVDGPLRPRHGDRCRARLDGRRRRPGRGGYEYAPARRPRRRRRRSARPASRPGSDPASTARRPPAARRSRRAWWASRTARCPAARWSRSHTATARSRFPCWTAAPTATRRLGPDGRRSPRSGHQRNRPDQDASGRADRQHADARPAGHIARRSALRRRRRRLSPELRPPRLQSVRPSAASAPPSGPRTARRRPARRAPRPAFRPRGRSPYRW